MQPGLHTPQGSGTGNRQEPFPLQSRHSGSLVVLGSATTAQLWLQTRESLYSQGSRKLLAPGRLVSSCSLCLISPHSWRPFWCGSKLWQSLGAVATRLGVCAHAQGGTEMPAFCHIRPLWTLGTDEHGMEAEERLKTAWHRPAEDTAW